MMRALALIVAGLSFAHHTSALRERDIGQLGHRGEFDALANLTEEGINDYTRAPEYSNAWYISQNLADTEAEIEKRIKEVHDGGEMTEEERKEIMQTMWWVATQELLSATQYGCADLCAVCVPPPNAFERGDDVQLKSIFIDRSKGWKDVLKTSVIAPVDAVAGAVGGVLGGVITGVAGGAAVGVASGVVTGVAVNTATNHTAAGAPGVILGTLAGLSAGVVSGAAILVAAEIVMPIYGVFHGVGLTGMATECSRVGFEANVNGEGDDAHSFKSKTMSGKYGLKLLRKAMNYDKSWFLESPSGESVNTLVARDSEKAQESMDYAAISHCEYLRFRQFDVRHVLECIKHSMLCGSSGAMMFPTSSENACKAFSNSKQLEDQAANSGEANPLAKLWAERKERAKCVKVLCSYKGFKRGALKTHPDKIRTDDVEEKARLEADFKIMNGCGDKFKNDEGQPLTLNKKEERDALCK